jgi:hypothetical protein
MVGPGGRPQPGRPIHSGGINPNIPGIGQAGGTVSAANVPVLSATSPVSRASPVRTTSHDVKVQPQTIKGTSTSQAPVNGVEDFQKWCRSQLKSLSGVNCTYPPSLGES